MNTEQFVSELRDLAPTINQLNNLGFSKSEGLEFIESYNCVSKKKSVYYENQLLNLLNNYILSSIEIASITFTDHMKSVNGKIIFGNIDSDLLVYEINSGIYLVDYTNHSHVITSCARSGENFLNALIQIARYSTRCLLDEQFREDPAILRSTIYKCSIEAGGEEYQQFYSMVLD